MTQTNDERITKIKANLTETERISALDYSEDIEFLLTRMEALETQSHKEHVAKHRFKQLANKLRGMHTCAEPECMAWVKKHMADQEQTIPDDEYTHCDCDGV